MEKRDNSFKIIAVMALVIAVAGLSIAYASFSASLTINGTATVSTNWDIKWANLTSNATQYATVGDLAIASGDQAITGTIGTLVAPGDTITYEWYVKNEGNINANLTGATTTTLNCAPATSSSATTTEANSLCDDLTFTITYGGVEVTGSNLDDLDTYLAKTSGSKKVVMTLSFDSDSSATLSGPVDVSLAGTPTFTYSQADNLD